MNDFMSANTRFEDRQDAGRQLAEALASYRDEDVIVLGLPRGGVPVAYEVARALKAPLDVVVARKVSAPLQPELAIGAIAPGGVLHLNEDKVRQLGLSDEEIDALAREEQEELERRIRRYRGNESIPDVSGRTAILVDDGIATGATATAALQAVRRMGPARLVLAAGVCSSRAAERMQEQADGFVCINIPDMLDGISVWYRNFGQTTDEEVTALLDKARRTHAESPP